MRKLFLKWMFKHHRNEVDDLYVADLFGDIPKEVTADALKVLNKGYKELDKFFRWNAYLLQRKIQQPLRHAEAYVGGLVFIQTLSTIMNRLQHGMTTSNAVDSPGLEIHDVEKELKAVDEFFQTKRSDSTNDNG